MKLFLIGTLLLSGGSAAAMQNEEVRENVKEMYQNVRQRVQKGVKENIFENIKEDGFPYPPEERLEALTEDQRVALLTTIDQINATYDWANMTDEEIRETLALVHEELELLAEELGFDFPTQAQVRSGFRNRVNQRTKEAIRTHLISNLQENGLEYPNEEVLAQLTEEQSTALLAKIDEFNATYNWAEMTDDEILAAMEVVRDELHALHDEFGIAPLHQNGSHRRFNE